MYIKNITQMLKENTPVKYRLFQGNTISGKIISLTDGKGAIKLYDGNIIPATFLYENELEYDKFTTFKIQKFDGDNLILKALKDENEGSRENIDLILNRLNITDIAAGRDIIMSLMKFGLPASDENILIIYKNITFLKYLKSIPDSKLLMLLKENISENMDYESSEFKNAKEIISKLTGTNTDILSFLLENNIDFNTENMLKMQEFNNKAFLLNFIINKLDSNKNASGQKDSTSENNEDIKNEKFINMLFKVLEKLDFKDCKLTSFKNIQEYIKRNPKILTLLNKVEVKDFKSNIDIIKDTNRNYNIISFNCQIDGFIYKNKIVIKDKYNDIDYKRTNNIKIYLVAETPVTGTVEAYIYKNKNTIAVQFNISDIYINLYKNCKNMLDENLRRLGFDVVDISFVSYKDIKSFTDLSDFFNDTMYKELDVLV